MSTTSDQQRHLVIILGIVLISIICLGGAAVAVLTYQRFNISSELINPWNDEVRQAVGATISVVEPGSPAANANLQPGQHILGINGVPIQVPEDLQAYLQDYSGGDKVSLAVLDAGVTRTVELTLPNGQPYLGLQLVWRDSQTPTPPLPTLPTAVLPTAPPSSGTPSIPPIVERVLPNSAAAKAGIQVGDVLTAVDGQAILSGTELIAAIGSKQPGQTIQLTLRRGPDTLNFTLTLGQHPDDVTRGFLGIELQGS